MDKKLQAGEEGSIVIDGSFDGPVLRLFSPSTPIDEMLATLKLTVSLPTHVRTAGDLIVALERKEIDVPAATAKKIRDVLA